MQTASRRTLVAAKMPGAFAVSTLTALLLSVTWADHHQHPLPHIEAELNCLKLSPFNADFAFALYKRLNAQTAAGHNIFFSPLGISTALSMLSAGASGETHSQLFSTLGYSTLNQTQVNNAYENLLHMLGQSHELEQLNVGNAVALRSNFSPLEKFLKVVRHYYSAEIFKVDLNKPDEAAAEINTFISNKTHDKIKDAVKEIDPDMVMLLINYVYFKAEWKKPFNRDLTTKADFNVNTATKVQVDMMMDTDFYDIYMDAVNHTTVIKLPYKGNTSMMIVLPDEGKMEEVEGFISKDHMRHWHNSLSKHHVDLYLPKFSISTEASLKETLQEMGITDAFGDQADFSGVSDTDRMKVSQVTHNAALSVTEMGTEAAAATIVTGVATSLPLTLKVDRPFLVCIWDHSIRSLLFMGKINNPTAM
ncbi:Alpha-1-antitrypsin -like protein Precursor [Channa argus]|uniref:Alpha-1-antitrypsin-like protein n=1 Tax=Channa argus TaxID=215402 RepID=A0A6G1QIT7_CHAAH|nr:Alpha-1-antitrypsin -like protein Precursor [Channa argus]